MFYQYTTNLHEIKQNKAQENRLYNSWGKNQYLDTFKGCRTSFFSAKNLGREIPLGLSIGCVCFQNRDWIVKLNVSTVS